MASDKGSDRLSEAIEKKFRDNTIELEVAAFLARQNASMTALVETAWFGSELVGNIVGVVKAVKTVISRSSIMRELKKAGLVTDDELTYDSVLDDIYAVPVERLNEKGVKLAVEDLLEMFESRRILYQMRDIVGDVRKGTFNLDLVKSTLRDLGKPVGLTDATTSGEYLEGYESRVQVIEEKRELRETGGAVGIHTGIGAFDRMTGGVMPAEFGVVGGKPGIGKTAFLASLGVHAWREQGKNVLFVSGEMAKVDIEFRIDSMVADVLASGFRLGTLSEIEMKRWEQTVKNERARRENFLEIVSFPKGFSVEDIEAEAMRIQDKHKKPMDLVIVDYLNILYPKTMGKGKGAKDWSSQADAVWEFKDMVAGLKISGWSAGQIRDEAIDSDVLSLADLKYARAISETSPIVLGLVTTDRAEVEHCMELQVLKMRNMKLPDKSIVLRPNLQYMRIHEDVLGIKDLRLMGEDVTPRRERKTKQQRRAG